MGLRGLGSRIWIPSMCLSVSFLFGIDCYWLNSCRLLSAGEMLCFDGLVGRWTMYDSFSGS